MNPPLSIILPARDEANSLKSLLPDLVQRYPDAEIIVVDDGSKDDTAQVCSAHRVTLIQHPYGVGNGGAVKTGARAANGGTLVFMDADGQHDPADIPGLLVALDMGYDMAVGARDSGSQSSALRNLANACYNRLASWMVGHRVEDLTSGFRAVRAHRFREFLYLLPNGFSYPTTITMAFFRAGLPIAYVPIHAARRTANSRSHIRPVHDGVRFLVIIFRVGTLYSPLKIFLPVSGLQFALGLLNYVYTYVSHGRFTNMSALLIMSSILIFLIGLVSEQITNLLYSHTEHE